MNSAKTPQEVHAVLANAYNTKNLSLVMTVYDAEGIIVPEPGNYVAGSQQFEQAVKNIMAIPGMEKYKLPQGELN